MDTSSEPPRPLARTRVIIVDDDISFREALEGWLGSLGYDTLSFGSAEEFLSEPETSAMCLLLDIQMPGKSGLDLQAELLAAGCSTPIIFITSRFDLRHRERAIASGAAGFLGKPFDRDVLLAIFAEIGPPASN